MQDVSERQRVEKILGRVDELFMRFGVKSLTMDELARELGISKKTLYKFVRNKKDLVKKTTQFHFERQKQNILLIREENEHAIDEIMAISRYVNRHLSRLNPVTMLDTKRYYPESWKKVRQYKEEFIYQLMIDNLQRGMQQGLYREDLDADLIARFYIGQIDSLLQNDRYPFHHYSLSRVYQEYINYHIRAIASNKGLTYLEKLKQQINDQSAM